MAAGLGFKDFTTGEVLTAADVDGYLMQGIWVFANATARDAAVTSPQEGNSCYLKDTDVIQVYSGSSWVVKSGGSSPLTTKGDLYTYSTTDTRLGVGTNGQLLAANSSTATGLEWQTVSSGGMTLISTTTMSGSSITLSAIPSTYVHLQLVITNYLPATTNTPLRLRFNGDTNARYKDGTSTTNNSQAFNATSIDLFAYQNNSASDGLMITDIYDYTNATTWKFTSTQVIWNNNTTPANSDMYRIFGMYNQTGAISSLTLFPNSGNFTSGTVKLYGVK
jgi:hypothetical protein